MCSCSFAFPQRIGFSARAAASVLHGTVQVRRVIERSRCMPGRRLDRRLWFRVLRCDRGGELKLSPEAETSPIKGAYGLRHGLKKSAYNFPSNNNSLQAKLAEREGFEPSRRYPAYTLSRRAPSTTRPPLRSRFWRGTALYRTATRLQDIVPFHDEDTPWIAQPLAVSGEATSDWAFLLLLAESDLLLLMRIFRATGLC